MGNERSAGLTLAAILVLALAGNAAGAKPRGEHTQSHSAASAEEPTISSPTINEEKMAYVMAASIVCGWQIPSDQAAAMQAYVDTLNLDGKMNFWGKRNQDLENFRAKGALDFCENASNKRTFLARLALIYPRGPLARPPSAPQARRPSTGGSTAYVNREPGWNSTLDQTARGMNSSYYSAPREGARAEFLARFVSGAVGGNFEPSHLGTFFATLNSCDKLSAINSSASDEFHPGADTAHALQEQVMQQVSAQWADGVAGDLVITIPVQLGAWDSRRKAFPMLSFNKSASLGDRFSSERDSIDVFARGGKLRFAVPKLAMVVGCVQPSNHFLMAGAFESQVYTPDAGAAGYRNNQYNGGGYGFGLDNVNLVLPADQDEGPTILAATRDRTVLLTLHLRPAATVLTEPDVPDESIFSVKFDLQYRKAAVISASVASADGAALPHQPQVVTN